MPTAMNAFRVLLPNRPQSLEWDKKIFLITRFRVHQVLTQKHHYFKLQFSLFASKPDLVWMNFFCTAVSYILGIINSTYPLLLNWNADLRRMVCQPNDWAITRTGKHLNVCWSSSLDFTPIWHGFAWTWPPGKRQSVGRQNITTLSVKLRNWDLRSYLQVTLSFRPEQSENG